MNNYKLYLKEPELLSIAEDLVNFTNEVSIIDNINEIGEDTYLEISNLGLSLVNQQIGTFLVRDIYSDLRFIRPSNELLNAAIKTKPPLLIFDLTAGLGKDALIMANYGYTVIMVERHPILATILYYALNYKIIPKANLTLIYGDALEFLINNQVLPDIIYLDPMFNTKNKSRAKKDMQLVQSLMNNQLDNMTEIFNLAKIVAKKNILVKRDDKEAPLVENVPVSYVKLGKTIRYDVYLTT